MRSMNSVRVHCSQWKSQMLQLKKKKKKGERTAFSPIRTGTKCKWCEKIYMAYSNFQV